MTKIDKGRFWEVTKRDRLGGGDVEEEKPITTLYATQGSLTSKLLYSHVLRSNC